MRMLTCRIAAAAIGLGAGSAKGLVVAEDGVEGADEDDAMEKQWKNWIE